MIRLVEHGSSEYWQALELRREVLRKPLGLGFTEDELASEDGQWHLVAEEGDKVVGCLTLVPGQSGTIKMRQVAVAPEARGSGTGRRLVVESEAVALRGGYSIMELHARVAVQEFYSKLGYSPIGEVFEEVTVPHIKMVKKLSRTVGAGEVSKA